MVKKNFVNLIKYFLVTSIIFIYAMFIVNNKIYAEYEEKTILYMQGMETGTKLTLTTDQDENGNYTGKYSAAHRNISLNSAILYRQTNVFCINKGRSFSGTLNCYDQIFFRINNGKAYYSIDGKELKSYNKDTGFKTDYESGDPLRNFETDLQVPIGDHKSDFTNLLTENNINKLAYILTEVQEKVGVSTNKITSGGTYQNQYQGAIWCLQRPGEKLLTSSNINLYGWSTDKLVADATAYSNFVSSGLAGETIGIKTDNTTVGTGYVVGPISFTNYGPKTAGVSGLYYNTSNSDISGEKYNSGYNAVYGQITSMKIGGQTITISGSDSQVYTNAACSDTSKVTGHIPNSTIYIKLEENQYNAIKSYETVNITVTVNNQYRQGYFWVLRCNGKSKYNYTNTSALTFWKEVDGNTYGGNKQSSFNQCALCFVDLQYITEIKNNTLVEYLYCPQCEATSTPTHKALDNTYSGNKLNNDIFKFISYKGSWVISDPYHLCTFNNNNQSDLYGEINSNKMIINDGKSNLCSHDCSTKAYDGYYNISVAFNTVDIYNEYLEGNKECINNEAFAKLVKNLNTSNKTKIRMFLPDTYQYCDVCNKKYVSDTGIELTFTYSWSAYSEPSGTIESCRKYTAAECSSCGDYVMFYKEPYVIQYYKINTDYFEKHFDKNTGFTIFDPNTDWEDISYAFNSPHYIMPFTEVETKIQTGNLVDTNIQNQIVGGGSSSSGTAGATIKVQTVIDSFTLTKKSADTNKNMNGIQFDVTVTGASEFSVGTTKYTSSGPFTFTTSTDGNINLSQIKFAQGQEQVTIKLEEIGNWCGNNFIKWDNNKIYSKKPAVTVTIKKDYTWSTTDGTITTGTDKKTGTLTLKNDLAPKVDELKIVKLNAATKSAMPDINLKIKLENVIDINNTSNTTVEYNNYNTNTAGEITLKDLVFSDINEPIKVTITESADDGKYLPWTEPLVLNITKTSTGLTITRDRDSGPDFLKLEDNNVNYHGYEYYTGKAETSSNTATITVTNIPLINIEGIVYLDGQAGVKDVQAPNGIKDNGEPGIEGIEVYLKDINGNVIKNGNGVECVATTGEDGKYIFTGILAQKYHIYYKYNGMEYEKSINQTPIEWRNEYFNGEFSTFTNASSNNAKYENTDILILKDNIYTLIEASTWDDSLINLKNNQITISHSYGLLKRSADLALGVKVDSITVSTNGKTSTETFGTPNAQKNVDLPENRVIEYHKALAEIDYNFTMETYKNVWGMTEFKEDDFEQTTMDITYLIEIQNPSGRPSKVSKIQIKENDNLKSATIGTDIEYYTSNNPTALKQLFAEINDKGELDLSTITSDIEPGNSLYLKIAYIGVPREYIVKGKTFELEAEILEYSTGKVIFDNGFQTAPYMVDEDSTPGNWDEDEDDYGKAVVKLVTDDKAERTVDGIVFDDKKTESSAEGYKFGNGNFDNDEDKLNGIVVQLIELRNVEILDQIYQLEYLWQETVTGSNVVKRINNEGTDIIVETHDEEIGKGQYLFKDILPGTYIVRFRYGEEYADNYVNVAPGNVVSTDYYNGVNYKSTTDLGYNQEWYNSTNYTNGEFPSAARDLEERRLVLMSKTVLASNQETNFEKTKENFDYNQDGKTDSDDCIILQKYINMQENEIIQIPEGTDKDVNADGKVDESDAVYLLRYTLFPDMFPLIKEDANFDYNQDGKLDSDDSIMLVKYVNMQANEENEIIQIPEGKELDVNADGNVNEEDAIYLLKCVLFPELFGLTKGMVAQTSKINIAQSTDDLQNTNEDIIYASESIEPIKFNNINFGLEERPETKVSLEKHITGLSIVQEGKRVLLTYTEGQEAPNLKVPDSNMEEYRAQFIFETDTELLQGADLRMSYTYTIKNNSDKDYLSKDLIEKYKDSNTSLQGYSDYLQDLASGIKNQTDVGYDIGKYLGKQYYTGVVDTNQVAEVVLKVEKMVDYLNNGFRYSTESTDAEFGTVNTEEKWAWVKANPDATDGTEVRYKAEQGLVNHGIQSQYPTRILGIGESTTKTATINKTEKISSTGNLEFIGYNAEVTDYSIPSGRIAIVPGINNMNYAFTEDVSNEDTIPKEVDESMSEDFIITTNTGLKEQQGNTTQIIIISASVIAIITAGAIIIKKFVIK